MPGFHLHLSNKLEILLKNLAEVVSVTSSSPLESEVIVVQNQGMEKWLTQQLAVRLGIWANCRFPFPNNIVEELFHCADLRDYLNTPFTTEFMTWKIFSVLENYLDKGEFFALKNFLGNRKDSLQKFQLCKRIATVLDQYMAYRPEMLLDWEKQQATNWQAQLWLALIEDHSQQHRVRVRHDFLQKIRQGKLSPNQFPKRISIFGISALPPFHFEIFEALSNLIEVHFFFVNPSREYWGDLISTKEANKKKVFHRGSGFDPSNEYFETGNPLLSSMGSQSKTFLNRLLDIHSYEKSQYSDPGESNLLSIIQSDILNLRNPDIKDGRRHILSTDMSLKIHSCHSPMREIEVLQDNLLDLFETMPDLQPQEVLVMAPDIELYAPFISAVFGGETQKKKQIPFSISDQSAKSTSPVIQTFDDILQLSDDRLDVYRILDLLRRPIVYRNFELSAPQLDSIVRWIKDTKIRWGIDGEHRGKFGLPIFEQNSWNEGLKRMLLGYALPALDHRSFNDTFPLDTIEGENILALGGLAEFLNRLFRTVKILESTHTLSEWTTVLLELVDQFLISEEENAEELQILRALCQELTEIHLLSGLNKPVGLSVVKAHLEPKLKKAESTRTFLSGGITFCSLVPMRSIPSRVIALIGVNNKDFPRNERPLSFDIMAQDPHPGDRSLKNDDRMLFLEALLSSREKLIISYIGQSNKDNHSLAPSVLVSELKEYVLKNFEVTGEENSLEQQILVQHYLNGFNANYFTDDPNLFTYSQENLKALKSKIDSPKTSPTPYFVESPREDLKNMNLDDLKRFFQHPIRYFFRQQKGLLLQDLEQPLEIQEPFSIHPLDAYQMKIDLLDWGMKGNSLSTCYELFNSRGNLPQGELGKQSFSELVTEVDQLLTRLKVVINGETLNPLPVDIELGEFHLYGTLNLIWPEYLVRYRCSKLKPKDQVAIWIDHLVLNCLNPENYPLESQVLGSDKTATYSPTQNCYEELKKLLDYFWEGQHHPLPFFLNSSYAYAQQFLKNQDTDKKSKDPIDQALRHWTSGPFKQGTDSEDSYHDLAFRGKNPFDDRFRLIAQEIFEPLLNHQKVL